MDFALVMDLMTWQGAVAITLATVLIEWTKSRFPGCVRKYLPFVVIGFYNAAALFFWWAAELPYTFKQVVLAATVAALGTSLLGPAGREVGKLVKKPGAGTKAAAILLAAFLCSGCGALSWLSEPDNLQAVREDYITAHEAYLSFVERVRARHEAGEMSDERYEKFIEANEQVRAISESIIGALELAEAAAREYERYRGSDAAEAGRRQEKVREALERAAALIPEFLSLAREVREAYDAFSDPVQESPNDTGIDTGGAGRRGNLEFAHARGAQAGGQSHQGRRTSDRIGLEETHRWGRDQLARNPIPSLADQTDSHRRGTASPLMSAVCHGMTH